METYATEPWEAPILSERPRLPSLDHAKPPQAKPESANQDIARRPAPRASRLQHTSQQNATGQGRRKSRITGLKQSAGIGSAPHMCEVSIETATRRMTAGAALRQFIVRACDNLRQNAGPAAFSSSHSSLSSDYPSSADESFECWIERAMGVQNPIRNALDSESISLLDAFGASESLASIRTQWTAVRKDKDASNNEP